jgi:CheY-like chemotaxis protein
VLIVDDEPNIRFVLRIAFEAAGHEVSEASNGLRALDEVASARPDLVATDFMMPVLDGGQLIARLRSEPATADIPILLISASSRGEQVPGADGFMVKPLDPAAVVERVEALLAGAAG